ncbi:MAG TPA: hypothetical protein HA362_03745 [Nanoarchaeota archaeon]|nr:hypothetical protein [Nanoarchaeota archaeon]
MKRTAALMAILAGCATAGVGNRQAVIETGLCDNATVTFFDYGFKVESGDSTFSHTESYNGWEITMDVPGGCNNRLERRHISPWNFSIHSDEGCNGSVDFFYEEFGRQSRREPVVEEPAGSVEATRYYSDFFELNVPEAARLWEEWKKRRQEE